MFSGNAIPRRSDVASSCHNAPSKRASPASSSVRRSGVARCSNSWRATLVIVSCSSVNVKSMCLPGRAELMEDEIVPIEGLEPVVEDLDGHSDFDVGGRHLAQVRHQPNTF